LIIDFRVRFFHWFLVLSFIAASFSGLYEYKEMHIIYGHIIFALLITRIIFGLSSSDNYLTFRNYLHTPVDFFNHLKEFIFKKGASINLHNPVGSYMVLIILSTLSFLVISGIILEGIVEYSGILSFLSNYLDSQSAILVKSLHKYIAYLSIGLAFIHIIGVILSSFKSKNNFPLLMIKGQLDE